MHIRTTVDLDRDLLDRAKEALDVSTYREAITRALTEAVARAELRGLLREVECSDLTWEVDELLAYRRLRRGDAS
jgi:Arc/MetJ family transcription regulator